MNTFDAIYQRRSIKHFDPDQRISEDDIRKLLDATIQSPTSFNLQHWRFVVLQDQALRETIRTEHGFDQSQFTDAAALILFTADVKAWEKEPKRYWSNAPDDVAELLVSMIGPFHEGRDDLQRDEAQRSIGMAMQTLMIAAKALGYDTCPMIGFDLEAIADLVGLPDDHVVGPIIAVGKALQPAWPKPGQLPLEDVLFIDSFDQT